MAGASADAGDITGKVHAEGKPGAEKDVQAGNYGSRAFKFAERVNYSEMRDFVVYIEGPMSGAKPVVPQKPMQVVTTKKVSQQKAVFTPHVLPVQAGTSVEWPNKDEIFHNVFSYSEAKPFDLGLYKDPEVKTVQFETPGRVDVFCSIHSSMNCVVLVLENPYFAMTNEKGSYAITNVPPGNYKVKAWHERLPARVQEVTVPEKGEVKLDFTLGITDLPKY
ncbi:MAG: hypothetical protein JWR26_4865 [Pedosphaera sp.]|nr:hypothetical protein [Pedosphaera sp.]